MNYKDNLNLEKLPAHVAIIMDGNGRWAKQKGFLRASGHKEGTKAVRDTVEGCAEIGVKNLTLYAFSTENWKRTQSEVSGLMSLFRAYIQKETRGLVKNNVKVRFIGDRIRLDPKLVALMDDLETATDHCDGTNLTVALNYGGRDEVARATKRLAKDVAIGELDPESIDEETLPRYLDTYVLPDPDLVIRTSGEARVSNFLLWQSAYAEYEFVDTLWPDFSAAEFTLLTQGFQLRKRNYGAVAE